MTAYVTVEREPAGAMLAEQPYAAGAGESLAGGAGRSAAERSPTCCARCCCRAATTSPTRWPIDVGGSERQLRRADERCWAALLGLGRTHFTTPIGLDTPGGNYSTRARPRAADARCCCATRSSRTIVDQPQRAARRRRRRPQPQRPRRRPTAGSSASRPGTPRDAGYCLVGAARLNGVHLISVVLGAPSDAARDADTLALLRYGLSRFRSAPRSPSPARSTRRSAGRGPRAPVRLVARALVDARARRAACGCTCRAAASRRGSPGRCRPARVERRRSSVARERTRRPTVPLVTAAAVPAPRPRSCAARDGRCVWIAAAAAC